MASTPNLKYLLPLTIMIILFTLGDSQLLSNDGYNNIPAESERGYNMHYNNMDDLRMAERAGYRNSMNQFYNNRNGYRRQHVQQGMSDTRFLENGKYYYDLKREARDPYGYQNWRALALTNDLQQSRFQP